MAVHLNARLNTRFIPILFSVAVLLSMSSFWARASSAPLGHDGALGDRLPPAASLEIPEAPSDLPDAEVLRDEIRSVMSESVDPSRIDRKPGLSPITVAPRPGDSPSTARDFSQSD